MNSIRQLITVSLVIGLLLVAIVTIISCYQINEKSYLVALDNHLHASARLINTISNNHQAFKHSSIPSPKHLVVQIFDANGKLIEKSPKAPSKPFVSKDKRYSTVTIDGHPWRALRMYDPDTKRTIIISELIKPQHISTFLSYSIIYILISLIIILSALIFFTLHITLRFISKLTFELTKKTSNKLEPLEVKSYPEEIHPMVIELNQLFFRVQDAFDRNKRFSADAAHELRTPLTALKTQAQLALQMNDPSEQKRAIENVLISVNRSIHVVQQLLTLSRLDHEQELNDVIPVNIEMICAEIIAYLYPQALEKHIEIELINECQAPIILGNDASLGILLRNLIDNAIRYTSQNGRVEVKLIERSRHIILQVADNGPGIPKQYQEKVFDRFFRVLGTKQTGSGLGLAIVKQITDLHGAQIFLDEPDTELGLRVNIKFKKYQAKLQD